MILGGILQYALHRRQLMLQKLEVGSTGEDRDETVERGPEEGIMLSYHTPTGGTR